MATVSSSINAAGVIAAARDQQRYRALNGSRAHGTYFLKWTKTLTAAEVANFDGAGDILEIMNMPPNCYLTSVSLTVPDMDANGAPAVTLDLDAGSTSIIADSTIGQTGGTVDWGGFKDISSSLLKLTIDTGPATAQTSYSAFTVYMVVEIGSPATVS